MKKSLKLSAAMLAISIALSGMSVVSFADKLKTVNGVKYVYSDDGKLKGKYSGWNTAKSGTKYYYKDGVRVKNSWLKEKGVRTYYVDNKGKAVVGYYNLSGVDYYFDKDAKLVYGIRIKGSKIDQKGMKLSISGEALTSNKADVWTTDEYYIERSTPAGNWEKLKKISNETGWTSEKIQFFKSGRLVQRSDQIDWSKLYGSLSNGSYRLCKDCYIKLEPNTKTEKKTLYVPFSIKLYDNAESAWGVSLSVSNITTDSITITTTQSPGHIGYITYSADYLIEQQDGNGNWKTVDKSAYDKAVFPDLFGIFGDYDYAPNATNPGGTESGNYSYYCGELDPGHYRIKRQFSGNCDGITGKLYATAEFDIVKSTPNGWGLSIGMSGDVCESGGTLWVDKAESQSKVIYGDVWTGEAYTLEKLVDNDWEDLESVAEANWNDIGITLENNKTRKFVINWETICGKLSEGKYRLGKTFYAKQSATDKTLEKTMFVEFVIGKAQKYIGEYELEINDTVLNNSFLAFNVTRSGKYEGAVSWNGCFELHKKNSSGKWKLYKGKTALDIDSDESTDFTIGETSKTGVNISSVYPELTSGTYRLKIKVQDQTYHIKYFYSVFTVK